MKPEQKNEGFVLTGVLLLLLIATMVGSACLFSARNSFSTAEQWRTRDDCLVAIQSAIEQREYLLYAAITNSTLGCMDHLSNASEANWSVVFTNGWSTVPSTVCVTGKTTYGAVSKSVVDNTSVMVVTNTAWAKLGKSTRKVREIVTLVYCPPQSLLGAKSSVFDNAFFIDNFGFFSGVNCDFNGDVYANKDMDLKYSSIKVNGDSYAAGLNVSKQLYKCDPWSSYGGQSYAGIFFGDRVRPAEYTDYNKANTNTYWPQGYKGSITFYDYQPVQDMPFIGPIAEYEAFAKANTGSVSGVHSVSAAGVLTNPGLGKVSAVWGDNAGEHAGIGTNDNGCLILIGTAANPIQLGTIFVARGDIYIKGYYTGQGTLYAGRNIYVIGSLIAKNPPTWPHPDSNPWGTVIKNRTNDFLGLCAKGSLSIGAIDELNVAFLKAPYTGSHASDISDTELGYVKYYSGGIPYFNGDYTQPDGNGSMQRSDGSVRRFYTPMISTTAFLGLGGSPWIGWMDAVLYANHLIAGDFDNNCVINGAFVCRDESVVRHGNLSMNWDIRIGSRSYDGIGFKPGLLGKFMSQPRIAQIVRWTELSP